MMLYPSMSTLLKNINSRYLLVNVTARRARQIATEAEEHRVPLDEKPVKMAIMEIANCKLTVKTKDKE